MPAASPFTLENLEHCGESTPGLTEFVRFYARNLHAELSAAGVRLDPVRLFDDIDGVERQVAARSNIHLARVAGQVVASIRCTPSDGSYRDLPIEREYGAELSACLHRLKRAGTTMEFARFAIASEFRTDAALILQLLKSATDTALANDIHFIILDTTASKMNLYRKLGFDVFDVDGNPEHACMQLWGHRFTMMVLNFSNQVMHHQNIRYDHGLSQAADRELISRWLASAKVRYASSPLKPWDLEPRSLSRSTGLTVGCVEQK